MKITGRVGDMALPAEGRLGAWAEWIVKIVYLVSNERFILPIVFQVFLLSHVHLYP
ncbi:MULTISPECIES: hypothetical protein [Streptomyces]|uniref:hypothetical protein n=1 Tax=Streptomyces TaxID=1883 RepID=UPI00131B9DC0|nr:hypothetical protein [Streptomyces virginiae]